jgi:hypothetical protein
VKSVRMLVAHNRCGAKQPEFLGCCIAATKRHWKPCVLGVGRGLRRYLNALNKGFVSNSNHLGVGRVILSNI